MNLSIITVNKNNYSGLEKTISSVVNQTYKDFEYIVIDGNSTDGSVETIKKYNNGIYYWVSEPDTGIYNAMNKGIRKARGKYCIFLNSGDWLVNNTTLSELFYEISNSDEADIYYGDCIATDYPYFQPPKLLDINYFITRNLNHQNTLIKRSLFLEHGFYNEKLKICSDYDFWLRESWIYKTNFIYIKTKIAIYDSFGISSTTNLDKELDDSILSVFGTIGESLVKLRRYSHSTYGLIIENYGSSKLLEYMLKTYKLIIKTIRSFLKR